MEFSFEYEAKRIYDSKTRESFQEVISSYNNGNYRSAVVMLYSVVICDLIYKLTELKDLYNDEKATAIIKSINEKQERNPTSPEWENELVNMIVERTTLINSTEHKAIQYLKEHRHLSAHPVMNENYILFKPNQQTVCAHMRNMLENVLTKTPLLSKKIVVTLLENLVELKDRMLTHKELTIFLKKKYFNHFTLDVEAEVFKTLWKIAFRDRGIKAIENRSINFDALDIMYKNHSIFLKTTIIDNVNYYSNIEDQDSLILLYTWLCRNPEVYDILDERCQSLIQSEVSRNINLSFTSWFITGGLEEHIDQLRTSLFEKLKKQDKATSVDINELKNLLTIVNDECMKVKVYDLGIELYGSSRFEEEADYYYNNFIDPHLFLFDEDQIRDILRFTDKNPKIYNRKGFLTSALRIASQAEKILGRDFKFNDFPIFQKGLLGFILNNTVKKRKMI